MANIARTPANTYKVIIRRRGWPTTIKTFRTKRGAQDWSADFTSIFESQQRVDPIATGK